MNNDEFIKTIKFGDKGLVPAIAQDDRTNEVLMLAYMDEEALRRTLATGRVHYYSRSRQKLWLKGETSGHFQELKSIRYDCDRDTILVRILQTGSACHTGHRSCFYSEFRDGGIIDVEQDRPMDTAAGDTAAGNPQAGDAGIIDAVYGVIMQRKQNPPPKSYVRSLMDKGVDAVNAKITEEASEVAEAGKVKNDADVIHEAADLIFHLLVLLGYRDIAVTGVYNELARRFGVSGIDEKASRNKQGKP